MRIFSKVNKCVRENSQENLPDKIYSGRSPGQELLTEYISQNFPECY